MTHYLVQPRHKEDRHREAMDFCLMLKKLSKNVVKNFSSKYSQNVFDHVKQYATKMSLKVTFTTKR